MEQTILVVEDEKGISKIIGSYLRKAGYGVVFAYDGVEAVEQFHQQKIDLVLLDLMLPKLSGEKVLQKIRSVSNCPVIMVTAKAEEDNRIDGFRLGADDYVIKPFSPKELMERIKAVLRRSQQGSSPMADFVSLDGGRLQIDFNARQILKDGTAVSLTNNEFQILKTIFSNPKKIFTREEIISLTFGIDYDAYDRAIDTHIKNIRQKIEDNPKSPKYIKTIYGVGYTVGVS